MKIEVLKSLEIPTYPSGKGGKMKVQKLTANICEIKWQPGVSIALNVCRCVRVCVEVCLCVRVCVGGGCPGLIKC